MLPDYEGSGLLTSGITIFHSKCIHSNGATCVRVIQLTNSYVHVDHHYTYIVFAYMLEAILVMFCILSEMHLHRYLI